jgi:hypothetical protein
MARKGKSGSDGVRKDGKPYKEGNIREDGSYKYGKYRPSPEHQFRSGDGRPRGTRAKGTKNLLTEWREELEERVTISEGGKTKKVSKRRALIKSQIDRGMKKSDRAAERALHYAELSEKREPGLQADDLEIIRLWLSCIQQTGDTDDADISTLILPDAAGEVLGGSESEID